MQLAMSCRPTNKISVILTHSRKTPLSLIFKQIGYLSSIWDTNLALELNLIKSFGYETNTGQEAQNEHQNESEKDVAEDTADEEIE